MFSRVNHRHMNALLAAKGKAKEPAKGYSGTREQSGQQGPDARRTRPRVHREQPMAAGAHRHTGRVSSHHTMRRSRFVPLLLSPFALRGAGTRSNPENIASRDWAFDREAAQGTENLHLRRRFELLVSGS